MTVDERDNDLRSVWMSQTDDPPGVSLEIVHARSRLLEQRVQRRNVAEYAGALVVVVFMLPLTWIAPNNVLAAGAAAVVAGVAYVIYRIHTWGSARRIPSDLAIRSSVELHRAELERQRDLLHHIWTWYLLPLWPGLGLILMGATIERPERWPYAIGTAALAVLLAFQIAWTNKRGAKTLQELIERLDDDPAAAFRSGLPSLTIGQRLSSWVMTSFVGAGAVLVVIQRFFPALKGSLPNLIVILILAVIGVILQAAWWRVRRRK
jgi:hypothetical protein